MYSNPQEVVKESERLGIITIGMTNLPSHFELGYKHILNCKKVRLALGLHPLHAKYHEKELPVFVRNIDKTSYIGEVGLDFSIEGKTTIDIQLKTFDKILSMLASEKKILSLHSRKAEKEVLGRLVKNKIELAIFHWYSGSSSLIPMIIDSGYMFSINTAMIKSKSGRAIIEKIPLLNLLTETDGPYIDLNGAPARPVNVSLILEYLSKLWNLPINKIENQIHDNFLKLISDVR